MLNNGKKLRFWASIAAYMLPGKDLIVDIYDL
ncbi:uncharacterized protein METZ01_LOCUS347982 [marine metagenome]|uniref:Uncharacterized protein n=1 Tax=marine metagenome TaxID=408172 RepID=A0A382RDQ9_9ZZZZ